MTLIAIHYHTFAHALHSFVPEKAFRKPPLPKIRPRDPASSGAMKGELQYGHLGSKEKGSFCSLDFTGLPQCGHAVAWSETAPRHSGHWISIKIFISFGLLTNILRWIQGWNLQKQRYTPES
jgi:hypothetical protein